MANAKPIVVPVSPEELCSSIISSHEHVLSLDGSTVYRMGDDDSYIFRDAASNRLNLEEDAQDEYRKPEVYVVSREIYAKRKLVSGKESTVRELEPHSVISARGMLDAIKIFEDENGRKVWMPFGERQDCQIGLERGYSSNQSNRAIIKRITKSNVHGISVQPSISSNAKKTKKKVKLVMASNC